jgi:hypothetical protein
LDGKYGRGVVALGDFNFLVTLRVVDSAGTLYYYNGYDDAHQRSTGFSSLTTLWRCDLISGGQQVGPVVTGWYCRFAVIMSLLLRDLLLVPTGWLTLAV